MAYIGSWRRLKLKLACHSLGQRQTDPGSLMFHFVLYSNFFFWQGGGGGGGLVANQVPPDLIDDLQPISRETDDNDVMYNCWWMNKRS